MKLRDIKGLDKKIVKIFEKEGISTLYPPQCDAIPPALAGKNILLSMPTASGKSLPAYLAVLHHALKGGKAIYIVPLKALASEKYDDFKKFEKLGIKVTVTTSDYDKRQDFEKYDIIVCTSERIDSLLRRPLHWLRNITVIVADEIHLLNDISRGAALEIVLTKFKIMNKNAQLIGLSATIGNPYELAEWLSAEALTSDFRPTKLHEGVFSAYNEDTIFFVKSKQPLELRKHKVSCNYPADIIGKLCTECILNGGQNLIFVNTKRSAEKEAKNLANLFMREKICITDYDKNITGTDEHSITLRNCVKAGVAFHTAVLTAEQRRAVEKGFKDGIIKCIIATPTLAAGINLPARRVIIRDVFRWTGSHREKIPVLEIKQYEGRAGRPKYDKEGEAIFIENPRNEFTMCDALIENYILADVEPITSKLAQPSPIRTHTLALIASEFATRTSEILKFYQNTFYGFTAGEMGLENVESIVKKVLAFLCTHNFIKQTSTFAYSATEFGKLTSHLYIDPLSAVILREALVSASNKFNGRNIPIQVFLQPLALTPDMNPFRYKSGDTWLDMLIDEYKDELLLPMPDENDALIIYLEAFKTACALADWANEIDDYSIVKRFDIGMGELHERIEKACWLLYAQQMFDRLFKTNLQKFIKTLSLRVKHGVKEELLKLCALQNIGRVRARSLYEHGVKGYTDIKHVDIRKLSAIPQIGSKIAHSLKEQVKKLGV